MSGEFPDLPGDSAPDGPHRPSGVYVICLPNTRRGPRWKDFLRGYGFQGSGQTGLD